MKSLPVFDFTYMKSKSQFKKLLEFGVMNIPNFNEDTALEIPKTKGNLMSYEQQIVIRFNNLVKQAKHYCLGNGTTLAQEIAEFKRNNKSNAKTKKRTAKAL